MFRVGVAASERASVLKLGTTCSPRGCGLLLQKRQCPLGALSPAWQPLELLPVPPLWMSRDPT